MIRCSKEKYQYVSAQLEEIGMAYSTHKGIGMCTGVRWNARMKETTRMT
jgi:hypothetical protein